MWVQIPGMQTLTSYEIMSNTLKPLGLGFSYCKMVIISPKSAARNKPIKVLITEPGTQKTNKMLFKCYYFQSRSRDKIHFDDLKLFPKTLVHAVRHSSVWTLGCTTAPWTSCNVQRTSQLSSGFSVSTACRSLGN